MDKHYFNTEYPSTSLLRKRAKQRMPKFAFEYLDGGCNEEVNLQRNTREIRDVELIPKYLKEYQSSSSQTTLFGKTYDAPFGVSPVGLQGLMWPNAAQTLAKAAFAHNVPFILSTVTTASIEEISELTEGQAWFQLYHPAEEKVRNDMINRAQETGYDVLVLLCDVPSFGFRPKDIKNGLAMPPKMSIRNIAQMISHPVWSWESLKYGQPNFEILKPYMPKNLDLRQLAKFMDQTFDGRLNQDRIARIRDLWKGKLVLKGVASTTDAETAIKLGLDGIIVSNHGGRQLDAGESTISPMRRIVDKCGKDITIMIDSGLRDGPDIARCMASGADFTFMGRTFMYGVGALGKYGGMHTMTMLKRQLNQIMEQLCCEQIADLPQHLK